jgi:hypothetical protein
MGSTVSPNVDRAPTVDILVDLTRVFTVLKGFCCWAVVLLMSFLSVFRALRHSPRSRARYFVYYNVFRVLVLRQILARSINQSPGTFGESGWTTSASGMTRWPCR